MGQDWLIRIEGGVSHIGAAALAQPYHHQGKFKASVSILTRLGHREDDIAARYARAVCEMTGRCVLAVCGIHYDEFDSETAIAVMDWVEEDLKNLLHEIEKQSPEMPEVI